jgi:hypothetical protein
MNVARDMLIGAGFTIVNENGNMANVEIGGNAAVLVMDDPERDPIGKCKIITDDAELEFDTIYDAAAYVDGIGKNAKEIHYFYERYIVVNPDIKCVVYTSDALEDCQDYIEDQFNPPEPLTETTRYNIIDTSEEADHPWYVRRYVKEVAKEDEE